MAVGAGQKVMLMIPLPFLFAAAALWAMWLHWRDPASGYVRRNISPPDFRSPIQLVEVVFPPRAKVAYETSAREGRVDQQIWVLDGAINILWGDEEYALKEGDCLAMQLDRHTAFSNPHRRTARYLVAITTKYFAKN